MRPTPAWLAAVETLLNRGIHASGQASEFARRLDATALRIDIEGLISIRASVYGTRLALIAAEPSGNPAGPEPDAIISGPPLALLRLAGIGAAARHHAPAARTTVRGDAEIANRYRELFAAARPDLEEELSHGVGDLAARRLSLLTKHTVAWVRKMRRTAGENIAEYLQEESRDLVNRTELEEFLTRVDTARETADRIGARLAHLEQRLKGST